MNILDALILTKSCKSRNAARKLIEQGEATILDMEITDVDAEIFVNKDHVILVQNDSIQVENVCKRGKSI